MTPVQENRSGGWAKLPVSLRAIVTGIVIALIPANVWPPLLLSIGVPAAATIEIVFLGLYLWWAGGGGPPARTHGTRAVAFRSGPLSSRQSCCCSVSCPFRLRGSGMAMICHSFLHCL